MMYIGDGGSGNYVKMVHNGIEYGDMQLISEAYDILKTIGGLTNEELAAVFDKWNKVRATHTLQRYSDVQHVEQKVQCLGTWRADSWTVAEERPGHWERHDRKMLCVQHRCTRARRLTNACARARTHTHTLNTHTHTKQHPCQELPACWCI